MNELDKLIAEFVTLEGYDKESVMALMKMAYEAGRNVELTRRLGEQGVDHD